MIQNISDVQNIMVIGKSTRQIVCSGKRAGYNMYALDYYCDLDLRRCSAAYSLLEEDASPENLDVNAYVDQFGVDMDAIILGPGFELADNIRGTVLNNDFETMKDVSNKRWLADKLNDLGMPHPDIYDPDDLSFPCVAKPTFGAGGMDNLLLEDENMVPDNRDDYVFQEYVPGLAASVSLISIRDEALIVGVNEQLTGERWLGQAARFGYSGNITPLQTEHEKRMRELAEKLVFELDLTGSNGVDFIISKDRIVIPEVNPRFQGSLDTVELSTGINLVDAHIKSFQYTLPENLKHKRFAAKGIVFADRNVIVGRSLNVKGVADVPPVGRGIPAGSPVATAIATGRNRRDAFIRMRRISERVMGSLSAV